MEETNYLKGLSPEGLKALEELKELQEWRNSSPENENEYLKMRESWLSSIRPEEYHSDKEEDSQRLLAHINEDKRKHRNRYVLRNPRRIAWQAAAAIALLVATSYLSIKIAATSENITFADVHIEASWGSKLKTILPDGTTVWLNANSTLTYSQGFGINDRNVHLVGEGYFEVAHNKDIPMIVQAGDMQIHVLGTKFNVRNHTNDNEAIVSLLEGEISITNNIEQSDAFVMEPNQRLYLNKTSGDVFLVEVVAEHTIEWTRGYLFFNHELLSDIAKNLERSYDVTITVHPDVANLRFYGQFVKKETSIRELLDILVSASRIEYSMTGREIVIK